MQSSPRKQNRPASSRLGVQRDAAGRRLVSQIELLRMRVNAAAVTWKQAKEQASQAKRRRKLAKLLARRAKKDAKTAKANLEELRVALADAQTRAASPRKSAARGFQKAVKVPKKKPIRRKSASKAGSPSPSDVVPETAEGISSNPIPPPALEAGSGEIPATT